MYFKFWPATCNMGPTTYDLQPSNYTLRQKENKILMLLPILQRITSGQPSIFPVFHDAVKTLHVRLQNSQFFFSQNQFSVDRSRVLQILTCNLQITPSGRFQARLFSCFLSGHACYILYQVNQSRRITSYPPWLACRWLPCSRIETTNPVIFDQKWRKLNRQLHEHYRSLNNHIAAFSPEFPKYNLKSIKNRESEGGL